MFGEELGSKLARVLNKPSSKSAPHSQRRVQAEIALIRDSGHFDAAYYAAQAGVQAPVDTLIEHFLREGDSRSLSPSNAFDVTFYLATYPDVAAADLNSLVHFLRHGRAEARYPSMDAVRADASELEQANVFDEARHIRRHGLQAIRPIEDYLLNWRRGRTANERFEDIFYEQTYAATRNTARPPIFDYIKRRNQDVLITTSDDLAVVRDSIMSKFDGEYYRSQLENGLSDKLPSTEELVNHYLIEGVNRGLSPSPEFSPLFYRQEHPDIRIDSIEPFSHFLENGRAEGRRGAIGMSQLFRAGDDRYDVGRRTVFIVNHDSSRTGAPLVGLNLARALRERWNVFVFVGREEALVEDFRASSVGLIVGWRTEAETEAIIREMKRIYRLDALVVNSIEGSGFVRAAVRSGVAVVALVHEFADYTAPMGRTADTVRLADRVIVPAALVEQSLQKEVAFVCGARAPNIVVRRQGALPYLPQDDDDTSTAMSAREIRDFVAERSGGRTRIVLGAGYVGQRKGVDLFVQTAAEVARRRDDVAFLWVGDGYAPRTDMHYSIWVEQMIQRMGLERIVQFLPSQPNLDASFDASAVFYLPSRLDPFPNVVIDALNASARVVCFQDATGCAELFTGEVPAFRGAAVPYCDVAAAADAIIAAIDASPHDADLHDRGEDTPLRDDHNARAAAGAFCFDAYVADLEREIELARASAAAIEDATQRIAASGSFDARFYEGAPSVHVTGALRDYVASSSKGLARRNPHAGFSDNLWRNRVGAGSARCALDEALGEDVTDTHACHRVGSGDLRMPQVGRVALHIHFHYADLAEDFVRRLVAARAAVDVFATVTSQNGLRTVEYAFMRYEGGTVQTILVPNRGRDVGPLLVDLGPLLAGYDIVGHLHAKRSLVIGRAAGDQWRDFLLDTLLGDGNGVLADILRLFAADPALGMVFPEDPHNVGWTGNRAFADALAARMTPSPRLPERPVFPIGTMFWARTQALQPLWNLALTRNDMPAEPLAYDGTVLHAVERMLPATCQATNLSWATLKANNTTR